MKCRFARFSFFLHENSMRTYVFVTKNVRNRSNDREKKKPNWRGQHTNHSWVITSLFIFFHRFLFFLFAYFCWAHNHALKHYFACMCRSIRQPAQINVVHIFLFDEKTNRTSKEKKCCSIRCIHTTYIFKTCSERFIQSKSFWRTGKLDARTKIL